MRAHYLSLFLAASFALAGPAHGAEIKVLSTNALKSVLQDLGPKFEQSSRHKLTITWGTAAQLKAQIENGSVVDVAILTDAAAADLVKQGKLALRTPIIRSGIAVAIRKGAARPALASVDDFRKMVLSAKSIAWIEQGAAVTFLNGVFNRLGISEQIKGKLKPVKSVGEAVANGKAEIGFTVASEILFHPGAEVGGMLPPDVQSFTTFAAGVHTKNSEPSEALVRFLKTPAAATVISAKGLEPL